jgi:hypothetical protein
MKVIPAIRSIRNRLRRSAKATSLCLFAARRLLMVCLAQAFANTLAVHRSSFSQRIGSALLALRNSSNSMSSLWPKFCGGALSWSPGVRCANNVSIVPNTLLHNPMNHQPRPRLKTHSSVYAACQAKCATHTYCSRRSYGEKSCGTGRKVEDERT